MMSGVASNFNLSLIEEYKKCPALYDCDNPDYKVHLPTKECWQKIADICGVGGNFAIKREQLNCGCSSS